MKRICIRAALLLAALTPASCGKKPESTPETQDPNETIDRYTPGEKPKPPLELSAPPAPSVPLDGQDLQKAGVHELQAEAKDAASRGEFAKAVQLQHWAVVRAGSGQYDLACYYARNNQAEAALYWLQEAGLKEGVDVDHARQDEDLQGLRKDRRWNRIVAYLNACNQYWAKNGPAKTVLVLPKRYRKGTELTAVVWLHGLGSHPDDFVNEEECQEFADEMNVAFIGVSGTEPRGPNSFVWAEDPVRDAQRIDDALKEVGDRVTVKPGHLITMGFSQGAGVGLEVAVRAPERFAGSIVMSSGCQRPLHLDAVVPSPQLARRGFVLTCGAQEAPGNVQQTKDGARWLREKAKTTKVVLKLYPQVSEHSFPPDFAKQLPAWVKHIEQAQR
jgi:predicted esterase